MVDFGVDFSNWGGYLDPTVLACWKAHDPSITFVVAGDQNPTLTRQQLTASRNSGFRLETYPFLYPDAEHGTVYPQNRGTLADQVRRCKNTIAGFDIKRIWLDVESPPPEYSGPWPSPAKSVAMLHDAEDACAPYAAGIYTGRYAWQTITGDSQAFAHLPLLHADYGPSANPYGWSNLPDPTHWTPYGGFKLDTWQFGNTQMFCGFQVDLNMRVSPSVEDDMYQQWDVWGAFEEGLAIPGGGTQRINIFADFNFPASPKVTEIEFVLKMGYIEVLHGNGQLAGRVGFGVARGRPSAGTVKVVPDSDGWITINAPDRINTVALVGAHGIAVWT